MTGKVAQIDANALALTLDTGGEAFVKGQPWRFAQDQGFDAQVDEFGRPGWGGQGRR